MKKEQVTIVNRLGLHARAASKFVSLSQSFSSEISLTKNAEQVDGKSIMSIMLLAAAQGTILTLSAEGEDEESAFSALSALIANRFDEPE
ncbi:MAG: HPr family phosphocarrier protein [Pseudomonadales bacterium]|nr:HPr family phosphocarrier protein [Pseudomonadales bacterium]